jgi:hypothetical protein
VCPRRDGDDPGWCAGLEPLEQEARQEKRREVVEGEGVLKPVDGRVAVGPEPADVVEQHIEAWIGGEDLGGQPPDFGLGGHVGDEDVHCGIARLARDCGGGQHRTVPVAAGDAHSGTHCGQAGRGG